MKVKITTLAIKLNCSTQSINNWYKWKELNPEHELAKLLPDYEMDSRTRTRYWEETDVWKILEFRTKLPTGRNGILGDVTQKRYRSMRKEKTNE